MLKRLSELSDCSDGDLTTGEKGYEKYYKKFDTHEIIFNKNVSVFFYKYKGKKVSMAILYSFYS